MATTTGSAANSVETPTSSVSWLQTVRERYLDFIARHEAAWELTFAALAVVYVVVGFVEDSPAVATIDLVLTAIFAAEFTSRLAASFDRAAYVRGHWIDALALIPAVRGVRVLRLLRLLRLVRAFAGVARALNTFERLANHRGLVWLLAAWSAVMILCSMALYAAENGVNEAIASPLDAMWWGITTMTTVGYGDVVPKTPEGRLAATILMVLGIGLFSAVTATVTSFLLEHDRDPLDQLAKLGELRDRGLVTEVEFAAKRSELGDALASRPVRGDA
jgi:voltage-gated potassium channel